MTVKFCLVPKDDAASGVNIGYKYINDHIGDLVDAPAGFESYCCAGWTHGTDFIVHNDKVYMLKKDFFLVDKNWMVMMAVESTMGCDVL